MSWVDEFHVRLIELERERDQLKELVEISHQVLIAAEAVYACDCDRVHCRRVQEYRRLYRKLMR